MRHHLGQRTAQRGRIDIPLHVHAHQLVEVVRVLELLCEEPALDGRERDLARRILVRVRRGLAAA